jgi:ribonuclease P protein component
MLPKQQRLHKAADFRKVRGRGRQWRSLSFLAFMVPSSQPTPRVGIIVSAKIGKAVVRKRAARILRSGYRESAEELGRKDIVLIARPLIKGRTSAQINQELQRMAKVVR